MKSATGLIGCLLLEASSKRILNSDAQIVNTPEMNADPSLPLQDGLAATPATPNSLSPGAGGDERWCPRLWNWIARRYRIRSVLDLGLGNPQPADYFSRLGLRVLCVDASRGGVASPPRPLSLRHDFSTGPLELTTPYDLVWTSDLLPILDDAQLQHVLTTMASTGRVVAASYASTFHHHTAPQSRTSPRRRSVYWIRRIESIGFTCLVYETRAARGIALSDFPGLNPFARGGLLFVRVAGYGEPFVVGRGAVLRARLKAWQIELPYRLSAAYRGQWYRDWQLRRRGGGHHDALATGPDDVARAA